MNYKLVIFDCDGVLVDSEGIAARVFTEEVQKLGYQLSIEEFHRVLAGGNLNKSIAYVEKQLGKTVPTDFVATYRKQSFEAFEKEIQPIEGIENILKQLSKPFCLASNAPRSKIELNLNKTKLISYFQDRIFSAYELEIWKPDPQFYLTVAKTMGYSPEDCIVVEDSRYGVRAAHQAGIRVLGYAAGNLEKTEELKREGAQIIQHMSELQTLLIQ